MSGIEDLGTFRAALAADSPTAITNVITGRPARGIVSRLIRDLGPLNAEAPPFPTAAMPLAPLCAATEAGGVGEFPAFWAGQAAGLGEAVPAPELTGRLAESALHRLSS